MIGARGILCDSGFWLGLFDPRDQYYDLAKELPVDLETFQIVVPWPSLYEVLSTRFVKDPRRVTLLTTVLRRSNIALLSDTAYRDAALADAEPLGTGRYRPLSLVDRVIRLVLEDDSVRVSALVTFNPNDFRDVCLKRGIEMVPAG